MTKAQNHLSERLRDAILLDGVSLNQLSQKAGLDRGTLSRFMRGERTLTLPAVSKLCSALGLSLVADDKPRRRPAPPATPPAGELLAEGKQVHPAKKVRKPVKRTRKR